MAVATVRSKGQITIPTGVRTTLGVNAGDRIEFIEVGKGGDERCHCQGSLPLPMIGLDANVVQPNRIELRSMDSRGRLSLHESLSIPRS